jgi:hypothetical protein
MRKFIDIVESANGLVPDFSQFVTPQLINELITTGLWTHHGSGLDEWWEEGGGLDYFQGEDKSLGDLDFYSALEQDKVATTTILERFLRARAGWIQRELVSGEYSGTPLVIDAPLHRAVMVNDRWLEAMSQPRKGPLPLGIFWGLGVVEPWGAKYDETKDHFPHMVEVVTKVRHVSINWYETFRSRLDWLNGDQESEIQLYPGSTIAHIERITLQASNINPALALKTPPIPVHPSATFIA